jgi:AcrR family transcriptional regulator
MAADGTREKLLNAATKVFVEKGFSGARVDEIAKRARANKAMIYYHFRDKQSLYQAVLLRLLAPIHDHIEALGRARLGPRKRLTAFYAGIVQRFAEKPALPHVMIREILAGGRHMDRETAQAFSGILAFVSRTLEEGRRAGSFRSVNPLLFHLSVIGPIFLFFVSTTFRDRLTTVAAPDLLFPSTDDMLGHIEAVLERSLDPNQSQQSREEVT